MTSVFISYSSRDRDDVEGLVSALRRADDEVWFDDELGGGDVWWQKILERIRDCEAFVFALSHNSLESKPCLTELRYAQALQKPVLPVQIGPVESMRVSPLAAVEAIDFRNPTLDTGIRLVTAVQRARERCGPLPDPLPEEPPVPYAYLMHLAASISDPELDPQQQAAILGEMRTAVDRDSDDAAARGDIAQLLRALGDRPDATEQTRTEAARLLAALGNPPGPKAPHDPAVPKAARSSRKLAIAAVAGLVVIAAMIGTVLMTRHRPEPTAASPSAPESAPVTVEPESLGSLLLTPAEITAVTGVANLTGDPPDDTMFVPSEQLSDPDCLGSDYAAAQQVYDGSGWSGVSVQTLSADRPDDPNIALLYVNQAAVSFPGERQAREFVDKSVTRWSGCSGQVVKDTAGTDPTVWTFGDLARGQDSISQISFPEGGKGWTCEHTLKAYSNSVFEVIVCGPHMKDEAIRLVDKMIEKAKA